MSTPKRFKTKVQHKYTTTSNSVSVKINPCLYLFKSVKFINYTAIKNIKGSSIIYKMSTR
jgi:hypothetical protein